MADGLKAAVRVLWDDVLADVLDPDPPEDADFFDLGGDSLLASELLERIEAATGVRIHFRRFLSYPTLDALQAMVVADVR